MNGRASCAHSILMLFEEMNAVSLPYFALDLYVCWISTGFQMAFGRREGSGLAVCGLRLGRQYAGLFSSLVGRGPQLKFRSNPFDTCPFRRTRSAENLGACAAPGRAAARQGQKQPAQESLGRAATFVRPSSSASLPQATPTLLPMASPPNAFNNELAKWVGNRCRESVVFVELRPRDADMVKQQWDSVFPISGEKDKRESQNSERLRMCKKYQCCTGSVVKRRHGESLWILTCAHVLGPVFKSTKRITAAQVNELYEAMILCDHQEQIYQREVLQNPDQERVYMRAEVYQISCLKDLMLLRIQAEEVQNCCPHPHRQLRMARAFPSTFESVVMLSWPIGADRTAVEGKVTHHSRPFKSLSKTNPCGYQMRLSQVNITSEEGSSGALLLDGSANYVGVLHGGNGKFSFYISYADLQEKLLQWDLI